MNIQIQKKKQKKATYVAPKASVKDVRLTQSFLQVTASGSVPGGAGDGGEF